MSLDSSLKTSSALSKHCNVLTRAQRIDKLSEQGRFDMAGDDPLGLVKVANRKVTTGGKSAKKGSATTDEESESEAEAAPAAK